MNIENIVKSLRDYVTAPTASAIKVILRSGRPYIPAVTSRTRPLIVMGNGPSLRSFLDFAAAQDKSWREGFDMAAVNFAAITPDFFTLKPDMYVLADPHFFRLPSADSKVSRLWENLKRCDWPMTLWIPARSGDEVARLLPTLPTNITVAEMNLTPVEGRGPLADLLVDKGLGMPRPRNVLIPAIMTAILSGYNKIFLVGADHSWSRTLWVDDDNRVVSIQPHFYKDDDNEKKRVQSEYAGYHLHDILESLTIAFRSYFDILRHATRRGVDIYNATPESFIDAFPRCGYEQMTMLSEK